MPTYVRSHCKINLGLAIGPPRPDGYHGLTTLYQTLALDEVVTVQARRASTTSITLTTNHPGVPTDNRNTAWKMVEGALELAGLTAEVSIHIQKELPVQGGLGAGSANAAAALIGLERELRLFLPPQGRLDLAAKVGSDVPLFLFGGAVMGSGRGEIVTAMPDLPITPSVVAVPEVGVSTPHAFQEWDALCASPGRLTSPSPADRLEVLSHVYASVFADPTSESSGIVGGFTAERNQGDSQGSSSPEQSSARNDLAGNPLLALVRTGIENDFEKVVFPQYPLLREIKRLLAGPPDQSGSAIYAALSGSGSALFGLYRNEADARAAQQRVQDSGCKAILTETLPRAEYWGRMFAD